MICGVTATGLTTYVGILQDGTLTVDSGRDDADVSRVLYSGDDTSGQHQLLPSLEKVEDVDTVTTSLEDIAAHVLIAVGGASVSIASDQLGDVVFSGVKAIGNLRHPASSLVRIHPTQILLIPSF